MPKADDEKSSLADLRRRIEKKTGISQTEVKALSAREVQKLVQELQVHQMELSLQNEELQRAQAELAQALDRYQDLYDFAPSGYLTLDEELRVLEANFMAARMLGIERKILVGAPFPKYLAPESQNALQPYFQGPAGRHLFQTGELELKRADGSRLPAHLTASLIWTPQNAKRLRMTLNDISGERRAQEKEARLAAIVNSTEDAIVRCNARGEITDWNPGAERMYGYSAEEILGRPMWVIVPPDLQNEETAMIGALSRGEVITGRETRRRTKQGREIPVSLSMSGLAGRTAFFSIERDITRQKENEETIRQNSRHKDEFLAILGHELRNPLAAVQIALERLQTACASDKSAALLPVLQWNIAQIATIVNDLMDVSRVMLGKIELDRQPVELQAVVRHALEALQALYHEKRVTVEESYLDRRILLDADPVRAAQIFFNLLENAAKYNHMDGKVWITARQTSRGAQITIEDTGIGMSPELRQSVFDLFMQADRGKSSRGGLGVGLTLAYNLTRLHGGDLIAASEGPGKGSTFILTLPLASYLEEQAPAEPAKSGHKALKLLLVDDNQDFTENMAELLKSFGHDVRTALTAAEGLAKAPEFKPDVIILDIGLPDLDGYEVVRRLACMPELRDTGFIALTGYSEVPPLLTAEGARFHEVLVKPVDIETMEAVLGRYEKKRD